MPLDKTLHASSTGKPLMPRLAVSASTIKSPITPRLATQHVRSTPSPSTLGPGNGNSAQPPRQNLKSPISKEDLSTPAKSILGIGNITPRSSSRKSRIVEAVSSQPTTPVTSHTPRPAGDGIPLSRGIRVGAVSPDAKKRPRSVIVERPASTLSPLSRNAVTFSPSVIPVKPSSPKDERRANGKFFHANEVGDAAALPPPVKKASTFFYANGEQDDSPKPSLLTRNTWQTDQPRASSPPLSTISVKSHRSQFYHADGTALLPAESTPRSGQSTPKSIEQSLGQTTFVPAPFRPPSPLKNKGNLHLTYRKGASQIISPQSDSPPVSASTILEFTPPNEDPRPKSPLSKADVHNRSASLGSLDTATSSPPSSRNVDQQDIDHTSLPTLPLTKVASPPPLMPSLSNLSSPDPTSPTANGSYAELAANARRERKVLDLEISNSSLLAVNKQLERELRRQKTEVRRWRRLTRAGRIESLGSVASSILSCPVNGEMDDLDEDDAEDVHEDGLEFVEDVDDSEADSDGDFNAQHRLERDEKRLRLDLSRHRQVLVDSQRMNQALKRCMAWTEEMIGEARRALEYKVWVWILVVPY
jgi:hypothetical protein